MFYLSLSIHRHDITWLHTISLDAFSTANFSKKIASYLQCRVPLMGISDSIGHSTQYSDKNIGVCSGRPLSPKSN